MATKKEIDEHLKTALSEIGKIDPWYDEKVNAWVFEHSHYPVGYAGKTSAEVVKKYPSHLREFILERLNNNLNPLVEAETKGHGGKRINAGRPVGTVKTPTRQIRVPIDLADWLKVSTNIEVVRKVKDALIMQSHKHTRHTKTA